jgi:hypothetical protein
MQVAVEQRRVSLRARKVAENAVRGLEQRVRNALVAAREIAHEAFAELLDGCATVGRIAGCHASQHRSEYVRRFVVTARERQYRQWLPWIELLEQRGAAHVLVHLHDAAAAKPRRHLAAAPFVALVLDDLEHDGRAGALAVHDEGRRSRDCALDCDAPGARAENHPAVEVLAQRQREP